MSNSTCFNTEKTGARSLDKAQYGVPETCSSFEYNANYSSDQSTASPFSEKRIEELGDLVTKVDEKPALIDPDGSLTKKGKLRMRFIKFIFGPGLIIFKYVSIFCLIFFLLTVLGSGTSHRPETYFSTIITPHFWDISIKFY
jgi:hypothetical protein